MDNMKLTDAAGQETSDTHPRKHTRPHTHSHRWTGRGVPHCWPQRSWINLNLLGFPFIPSWTDVLCFRFILRAVDSRRASPWRQKCEQTRTSCTVCHSYCWLKCMMGNLAGPSLHRGHLSMLGCGLVNLDLEPLDREWWFSTSLDESA